MSIAGPPIPVPPLPPLSVGLRFSGVLVIVVVKAMDALQRAVDPMLHFPVAETMRVCFLRFALLCNLGQPALVCVFVSRVEEEGRRIKEDMGEWIRQHAGSVALLNRESKDYNPSSSNTAWSRHSKWRLRTMVQGAQVEM
jgi:hypothetical protein